MSGLNAKGVRHILCLVFVLLITPWTYSVLLTIHCKSVECRRVSGVWQQRHAATC